MPTPQLAEILPQTVQGLPLHPLIVHATVVILPLAAAATLLHALWPAARARLGALTPLLALASLVLVPLSTATGENLEALGHAGGDPLVERHAQLADQLLPWTALLVVAALFLYTLDLRARRSGGVDASTAATGRPRAAAGFTTLGTLAVVLAVVAGVGVTQQVVRVGHAGASAAWSDYGQQ